MSDIIFETEQDLVWINPIVGEIKKASDISSILDIDMSIVLAKYRIKNSLDNADRSTITNLVIKHLLVQDVDRT